MRGSPSNNFSLLGGLDAEKQLKKAVICHFLKNPRWLTFLFDMCIIPWLSHFRWYNILFALSCLWAALESLTKTQTDRQADIIAYYCPAWAVAWAGEKNTKMYGKFTKLPQFCQNFPRCSHVFYVCLQHLLCHTGWYSSASAQGENMDCTVLYSSIDCSGHISHLQGREWLPDLHKCANVLTRFTKKIWKNLWKFCKKIISN